MLQTYSHSSRSNQPGKGPLISKYLFGIFNSPQKQTKNQPYYNIVVRLIFCLFFGGIEDTIAMVSQVELFSFVFLGELKTPKSHFEIN